MILKLSLNIQMLWAIFIKILENTIQIKNWIWFDIWKVKLYLTWLLIRLGIKKINPTEIELFIRDRKFDISIVFTTLYYFAVPKDIRLNSTHYFIMKIPNRWQPRQTAFTHSSDIDFRYDVDLYKKRTAKPYSFLAIDSTFASHNPLHSRNNLLEII